ncbi:MAG: signal peptide peptidase SppA [Deltaproteobacteria bacterium]|nr:signal peptide peptidase SppA [Deltaproteobacteria bacterium]
MKAITIALAIVGGFFLAFLLLTLFIAILVRGDRTFGFKDKVAVVEIEGIITDPTPITRQLIDLGERGDVKAIVLRVDSPGGGVGPSQEIYQEVKRIRDRKKVVVSMGSVAASGGYYVATPAHTIVANPGTITGSIGVIMEFANIEELLAKLGLKGYVIKSGEYKDIGSPLRPMKEGERRMIQGVIEDVHQQFIDAVAEGRGLDVNRVKELADGRIFTGAQAIKVGLVDKLGNLQDAIDIASSLAGIKGKPTVVYPPRRGINVWDILFGDSIARFIERLKVGYELNYRL